MRTGQDRGQVKIVLIIQALCVPGGTGCEGQCVEEVESALNKWYVMRGLGDKSCLCVILYSIQICGTMGLAHIPLTSTTRWSGLGRLHDRVVEHRMIWCESRRQAVHGRQILWHCDSTPRMSAIVSEHRRCIMKAFSMIPTFLSRHLIYDGLGEESVAEVDAGYDIII